jgi:hypothetical protein
MKVYVVATGEYSDYRVRAVCSTMERAEQAMGLYAKDDDDENPILEFDVDYVPPHPKGCRLYSIRLRQNGDVHSAGGANIEDEGPISDPKCSVFPYRRLPFTRGGLCVDFPALFACTLWAETKERAIKVANEHRARWIADGRWLPDPDPRLDPDPESRAHPE